MAMSKSDNNLETKESEEIREMFCEHCENEGKYATATGFCVDCNDFMCDVCMKYHDKYHSEHVTQDKYEMPQEYCFEKCSIHSKKCIKFYCSECTKFACPDCVSIKDSSHEYDCKSKLWSPLDTVVHNTEDISTMRIDDKVANITGEIKKIEDTAVATRKKSSKRKEQVRKLVTLHRKETEQRINYLERQFLRKIDETDDTFKASIDSIMNDVGVMKMQIGSAVSYQNRVQQSNNSYSRFIATRNLEREIRSATVELRELTEKMVYKEYDFEAAKNPIMDRKYFGVFVSRDSKKPQIAVYKYDLDVGTYYNWIWSGRVSDLRIHSGFLVAAVQVCNIVVLIDHTEKQILSKITTSSNPARVAFIEKNKVAVTLPKQGKVVFYGISDTASLEKQSDITVEEGCLGLTYSKGQDCLYVSYSKPKSKITIITVTGTVIRVLDRDILENKLFKTPENIALSLDEKSLYVADREKHMVIKISIAGNVEAVCKDDQLQNPYGIAVDENESIYVCGQGNVLHLASDLSKVSELINIFDLHFFKFPLSIAVCSKANLICIGLKTDATIKCFGRFNL